MKIRKDIMGKTPEIGDIIAYNPPYYKGIKTMVCVGFAKSGLPYLGKDIYDVGSTITPKTDFAIV